MTATAAVREPQHARTGDLHLPDMDVEVRPARLAVRADPSDELPGGDLRSLVRLEVRLVGHVRSREEVDARKAHPAPDVLHRFTIVDEDERVGLVRTELRGDRVGLKVRVVNKVIIGGADGDEVAADAGNERVVDRVVDERAPALDDLTVDARIHRGVPREHVGLVLRHANRIVRG